MINQLVYQMGFFILIKRQSIHKVIAISSILKPKQILSKLAFWRKHSLNWHHYLCLQNNSFKSIKLLLQSVSIINIIEWFYSWLATIIWLKFMHSFCVQKTFTVSQIKLLQAILLRMISQYFKDLLQNLYQIVSIKPLNPVSLNVCFCKTLKIDLNR